MTSINNDCKMIDLSISVACLIVYIKKHKYPCGSHLDALSEKIRGEVKKQIRQTESLHEKLKEVTDDLENYRLQLKLVSISKDDFESELHEVRHKKLLYEKKWKSIVENNERLNKKSMELERSRSVLKDRHKQEIETLLNAKKKEIQVYTTEQARSKSYITNFEEKTKEYQNKIIEMNLKHEQCFQEMERKLYQLEVCLQENMIMNTEKDEIITSNGRKIKDQCSEIDHLRENMKVFSIEREHEIKTIGEEKRILEKKNEELSGEMKKVLETLLETDSHLDACVSSLKTGTVSITACEENSYTRYKHETHNHKTSDWKEVAYSIKKKISNMQGNIYDHTIKQNNPKNTNDYDKKHDPLKNYDSTNKEFNKSNRKHANYMKQHAETQTELNDLHDLLIKNENKISRHIDDKMRLQKTIEQKETLLQQLRAELNCVRNRNQDNTETVNSIKKINDDLAKECDNLRDKLKIREENALRDDKENGKLVTELRENINKNLTDFKEREAKYHHDLTNLRKVLGEKDVQLSQMSDQLIKKESVKTEHVRNVQELLDCKHRLTESEEQLKNIQNEQCQLKTKIEVLKNELEKKEDELNKQKAENDQDLNKMKESEEKVILMEKRIRELETDAVKKYQTKADIERQLECLNKSHAERITEKDRNISNLNETIIRSKKEISDLKETKRSLKLDQMNREEHISVLNDKLKQYTNLANKNESKMRDMEKILHTEKTNYDSKVYFSENIIAQKDKIVVELKDKMSNMEAHVKALGKEIKERDAKIDALNVQLQQSQKHRDESQKNLEDITNSKQKLILNLQKDVEQRDSKISSLEKKIAQESLENLPGGEHKIEAAVTNEIKELKRQLKLTMSKLHDTEAELDDTKTRLSKAMGDRLTDNNPNITDLSDRNRPTKLAEKCAELYDNQWTDAFEVLETHFPNDEAVIEALLHILQVTMTFCQEKAQYQMDELGRTLTFADRNANADQSLSVYKQLKDTRKATALSAVKNLREMFISYLRQTADQTVSRALEIKDFTFECLEMCWLMMVNDPPVAFAPLLAKGTHFNSDLYKPYTTSGSHVEYVVWPALLLHEGGPILAKGVAQGINKSKKSTKHKKSMSNKQF